MPGPLEGINVVDVSQAAAGPVAAMQLAEMGANVIKVEPPWGDFVRNRPPHKKGVDLMVSAFSRSKRSVILDLRKEKDKAILLEMIKRADVFVENYKVGTADRMGLGYEALTAMNPRLIYCSVAGFGHKGPLRERGSMDTLGQVMAGLGSISGPPGGPGEYVGMITCDVYTPAYACQGILMALFAREFTGRGQKIETSQMEAGIALQQSRIAEYFATGVRPEPLGSASLNIVPSQAFQAKDDYIVVEVPTERIWRRFCTALQIEELAENPSFATNALRVEHRDSLTPLLENIFQQKPTAQWLSILRAHEVPCSLILRDLDDLYADPQIKANGLIFEIEHPKAGVLKTTQVPWKFSETPGKVKSLSPMLGEHQKEVLSEFGFEAEEVPDPDRARSERLGHR